MKANPILGKLFPQKRGKYLPKEERRFFFEVGWMAFYVNFKNIVRTCRMDTLLISSFRRVSNLSIMLPNYTAG